jgi:hypothetical protein
VHLQHCAAIVHACRSKVVPIAWVPCHPPYTTAKLNLHIHKLKVFEGYSWCKHSEGLIELSIVYLNTY